MINIYELFSARTLNDLTYPKSNIKQISSYKELDFNKNFATKVSPDEVELLEDEYTVDGYDPYRSNICTDIFFNVIYKTKHPNSYNDEFIVTQVLKCNKTTKDEEKNECRSNIIYLIKIYFLTSNHTIITTYTRFKHRYIYNPYHPQFFGRFSIGNIDIFKYEYDFYIWFETISRIGNPLHPEYFLFGGAGFDLANYKYACFENFVMDNEERMNNGTPCITDPNDHTLYLHQHDFPHISFMTKNGMIQSFREVSKLNNLRYPEIEEVCDVQRLQLKENLKPLADRALKENSLTKHAGGRPKKKKQMYHVIDPSMIDKFEANFK